MSSDRTRQLEDFMVTDDDYSYERPGTPAEQMSTSDDSENASKPHAKQDMPRQVRGRHWQRLGSSKREIQCSMTLHDALNRGTSSAGARPPSRVRPRLTPNESLEDKITRNRELRDGMQEKIEILFRDPARKLICETWSPDTDTSDRSTGNVCGRLSGDSSGSKTSSSACSSSDAEEKILVADTDLEGPPLQPRRSHRRGFATMRSME
jgi:hypothetical protein